MSFLVSVLKPLAYVSLPVFLLRLAANTHPYAHYIVRLGLYTSTMVAAGAFGFVSSLGMSLTGNKYNVNWVVARTFYAVASTLVGITVEVEGEEHLEMRPAVFLSNHQSMLDILILGKIFPKQTSIMSKKEVQWSPLGPFMTMSGAVFVDRGNSAKAHRSLEAAGEGMKARKTSIIVYPEGTRNSSEESTLLPFKKGAFHLAIQAGLPIIPVVTENYWRVYHGGVFGYGTLKVRVLPPVPTSHLTAADVGELAGRVRDQMLATLRDLSPASSGKLVKEEESDDRPHTPTSVPRADQEEDATRNSVTAIAPAQDPSESVYASSEASVGSRTETEEDEGMVLVGRP